MNRLKEDKKNISQVIAKSATIPFPFLLGLLRTALRLSRKQAARDLGICHLRLFDWEHGNFSRPIKKHLLTAMAKYYGIKYDTLSKRCMAYIYGKAK